MKPITPLLLLLFVLSTCGIAAVSSDAGHREQPWMKEDAATVAVIDEHCCSCDDCEQNGCDNLVEFGEKSEAEISPEQMVAEVEMLWEMWFDDENAPANDKRRQRFTEFAEYLVDAVIMYQNEQTDIGGQLPGAKNDHLVVAYMVAKESSVTYDVVGTSHEERGLMQLHGVALAGYSPDKVQNNPRLGLLLGVRWLASFIPQCQQDGAGGIFGDEFAWEDSDWIGPLSVYAGGPRGFRKDGRCAEFRTMRDRINAVRMYRTRIDHKMSGSDYE